MATTHPTLLLAFLAGVLSFVSPCLLPIYPSYISYISGVSFKGNEKTLKVRTRALTHTVFFVIGFSIIFFALGLTASFLGEVFSQYHRMLRIIGGAIVFLMGLFLSGLLTPTWMMREFKWNYRSKRTGYLTSVLMGISFSLGWTPCIGPILGSILTLAAMNSGRGMFLMSSYIIGFAIPFFILAFSLTSLGKWARHTEWIAKVGGFLLMILGILLLTNEFQRITVWLIRLYGGFQGF